MKLKLHTEFTFDSAHRLENYNGKCCDVHGHTWKVELWFIGSSENKDDVGILVDFGIVKEVKELLDHKYLNDILGCNPTAENLTEWIFNFIDKSVNYDDENQIAIKVRVYETAVDKKTWCEGGDFE